MRISDWSSDVCSSDLHNVSIFHCDHAGRIANAVRARRTGRDNGVVRAHQAIFNTDLPRNQVDETTMNEMWGNAARSLFVEHNGLALNTWKAANTRADREARTQALDRKSTRLNSSHSCAYRMPSSD